MKRITLILLIVLVFGGLTSYTDRQFNDKFFNYRMHYQNNPNLSEAIGTWEIDGENSTLNFKIGNMWIMNVTGTMGGLNGEFVISKNISGSTVNISLQPKTINTGIEKRDNHLRNEEFFNVEKYQSIVFKGNAIYEVNKEFRFIVKGKLTIKNVNKEIEVPFNYNSISEKNGTKTVKFSGEVVIDRRDFHLDDFGGMGMDDEAIVNFELKANKL